MYILTADWAFDAHPGVVYQKRIHSISTNQWPQFWTEIAWDNLALSIFTCEYVLQSLQSLPSAVFSHQICIQIITTHPDHKSCQTSSYRHIQVVKHARWINWNSIYSQLLTKRSALISATYHQQPDCFASLVKPLVSTRQGGKVDSMACTTLNTYFTHIVRFTFSILYK